MRGGWRRAESLRSTFELFFIFTLKRLMFFRPRFASSLSSSSSCPCSTFSKLLLHNYKSLPCAISAERGESVAAISSAFAFSSPENSQKEESRYICTYIQHTFNRRKICVGGEHQERDERGEVRVFRKIFIQSLKWKCWARELKSYEEENSNWKFKYLMN